MTTRHLPFRVHPLECIHLADNRQNFLEQWHWFPTPIRLFAARPPRR